MTEEQKQAVYKEYSANNMAKLRQLIDKPLSILGGLPQMDYDDFLSMANFSLWQLVEAFDEKKGVPLEAYLRKYIPLKIFQEKTYEGREKRKPYIRDGDGNRIKDEDGNFLEMGTVYLDAPRKDGIELSEKLASDFTIENELELFQDERVEEFLGGLGALQREILELLMEGYTPGEIRKKLGLTGREYGNQLCRIKSFQNIKRLRVIFAQSDKDKSTTEEKVMEMTQTAEKSKPMQYSIAAINKKIENRTIRFDHPLQRESDQWSPAMKGNLISDILQGNPLPEIVFAEQIINGIPVIWDLDGKQRCTNCYSFANNGFKISRNIRRWNIQYLEQNKDKNGRPVLDQNGFPTSKYRVCDIRNKKFSQLPEELQEKFLDYTFKCDQYLNCDSEEIAYHIIRYNEGKAMSVSQKGITRIGEEFAALVKSISAMPFFQDKGGYKVSETKNGTLERVVVESVMASKFLEDWNKKQDVICAYLKEHATSEDFYDFEDMVTRLDEAVTEEVAEMFDAKDSFLWFSLFSKFRETGRKDEEFVEFMAEFARSLHKIKINGHTWESLGEKPTKDKNSVMEKRNYLEYLMLDYLNNRAA